jgi:hypothetical protein
MECSIQIYKASTRPVQMIHESRTEAWGESI